MNQPNKDPGPILSEEEWEGELIVGTTPFDWADLIFKAIAAAALLVIAARLG